MNALFSTNAKVVHLFRRGEKEVLDFVKRQQAEIERLRNYKELYEELKAENLETIRCIRQSINSARAEIVKEFADKICNTNQPRQKYISINKVKKLMKEMTEERK